MISRSRAESAIGRSVAANPITAILGPRQCGKTTLARRVARKQPGATSYFDLENPRDRARLAAPLTELERLEGLVVLDEVQQVPELFDLLRVLSDRPEGKARYLLLGSASPDLVRGAAQSLAGRIGFVDLGGFALDEVGTDRWRRLWLRGGFPRSYLAEDDGRSFTWREDFARTFLERDIPQLGITIPAASLRRFWTMVAHYHGQTWNAAEFARSLGSSEGSARRYLDLLTGAYMIRQLQPWHENLKKRQVKSPKVYLRDSGLLHSLLTIPDESVLLGHVKCGASWEGFVIEQILSIAAVRDAYYWATYSGAELDLLVHHAGRRIGFEVKLTDAPTMSKSLAVAMEDLKLDQAFVVYPGDQRYALAEHVEACPVTAISADLLGPARGLEKP